MARTNIADLMETPAQQHDIDWLHESLQWAVELEFATIPVYLSGLWSIKDQSGEVYNLINSVVMEEMLHMGLACNLVTAIGGTPEINPPTYPGPLPGGVRPDLTVSLRGLSQEAVKMYMKIEQPEHEVDELESPSFPTIGAFYDAILAAFEKLRPQILPNAIQLTTTIGVPDPNRPDGSGEVTEYLKAITWLGDVKDAIAVIKDQGEGTGRSPEAPQYDDGELAHFYRFAEIARGRRFVESGGRWSFSGDPVPFPECYLVKEIPKGGYPTVSVVQDFDRQYTELIGNLRKAWSTPPTVTGDSPALDTAIGIMVGLYAQNVKQIVSTPLPGGGGNYGPDFQMLPVTAATPQAVAPADAAP